jgi:GT2 family glycosyltransferase
VRDEPTRVPTGRAVAPLPPLLSRVAHVWQQEGVRGLAVRVGRRLARRSGEPGRLVQPVSALPRPLPRLVVAPLTDARGVSIVIPVFNHAPLTYQCLASILERTPRGRYEVVVVDNASHDETPRLLAHVEGLRAIRNAENRGFVDACNQGAGAARGEHLLFLNNDTVVLEGWLEALLDPLARDPRTGAVGAQLLYPDGRLQEAGGIIWRDGTGWNYGRGDDPHRPEYRYAREVDFCSGACLLVRRALFERLGGFDRRYAPAYYEDVDLCFGLRDLGFRVVYQPRARVVHLEGSTAGTDLGSGFKRFQAVNRATFARKHAAALARQSPPDAARVFRARDRRPGKRILIVDHMVPLYDQDAGSLRMLALLEILGELGHAVTFVPDNLTPFEPYTERLQQLGVEVLYGPLSILDDVLGHVRAFDLIVVCRATIAGKYLAALAACPDRPPVVFDTIDLHYLRAERRAALEGGEALGREAAETKAAELGLARASDMTWVVSAYEAELLRREDPALRVAVVPLIHRTRARVPPFEARRDLLFLAGFRHPPNEDAVVHLATAILPRVRRELPEVRLRVAGSNIPPAVERLASEAIEVVGHVAEVEPVFDACRVFAAPIRYGAGLKGKVTHSLACGLPVVTTAIGAEGLHLVDGEHALIADQPEAFAARVVELYRDPALWTRLSARGRSHVETHFGHAAVKAALDATLRAVCR